MEERIEPRRFRHRARAWGQRALMTLIPLAGFLLACRIANWRMIVAYHRGEAAYETIPEERCARFLYCLDTHCIGDEGPSPYASQEQADRWNTAWDRCSYVFPNRPWHGSAKPPGDYWIPAEDDE